ncbi:MAG TPA: Yip1 family protein [Candidatus Atribacteria bacterium]|nr:Yip1 family protein [Candidatus Atribacteria bacterium]
MEVLRGLRYVTYLIFHPFNGFWDLKHEKKGNLGSALVIVALLSITYILRRQATGFIFNTVNLLELNILVEIISVVLPFMLWCISNWCLTTLMDGEGSFKDIIITSAYALTPLILINLPMILVSNVITVDEGAFYYFFISLSTVWAAALMLVGTSVVHQYSMTKAFITCICIIVGVGLIIFIGLLFFSLLQQMFWFAWTVFQEISLRF